MNYFCLRTASFGPKQSQKTSQGFRSVLQTACFCLRTASFGSQAGKSDSQRALQRPAVRVHPRCCTFRGWRPNLLPHAQAPAVPGSRRASLVSMQRCYPALQGRCYPDEPFASPGSGLAYLPRTSLRMYSFRSLHANWPHAKAHFCLGTASFGSTQSQEPSHGFRFVSLFFFFKKKKEETIHFWLRKASFEHKQNQKPKQVSRSVLKIAHFSLRTASFG